MNIEEWYICFVRFVVTVVVAASLDVRLQEECAAAQVSEASFSARVGEAGDQTQRMGLDACSLLDAVGPTAESPILYVGLPPVSECHQFNFWIENEEVQVYNAPSSSFQETESG